MSNEGQTSSQKKQIDPAIVAAIAREVIARLKSTSNTNHSAASLDNRVITAETIEQLSGTPTQLFIAPDAVVTPAARDEVRRRRITMNRSVKLPAEQQPIQGRLEIIDSANPERADAVRTQLAKRGIEGGSVRVVLTDTPATDVYQQCTTHRERAVMVNTTSDVQRFADELAPTVWVLDMKRLNLTAATNVIAQITRFGKSTQ